MAKLAPAECSMPWSTGQDREIAGAGQPAVAEQPLEVAEHPGVAVAGDEDAVDEVGAGQVQRLFGDRLAHVLSAGCRPRSREARGWGSP